MRAGIVIADAWEPPSDGAVWFADPVKRANYERALRQHDEQVFREACDFYIMWRREIDQDTHVR